MLEDNRLKVFKAVAEEGSFTRAARSLGVTQSAVSQCIADLEREAGVLLFERTRRAVVLTAAGETFLRHAGKILRDYAALGSVFAPTDRLVSRRPVTVFAPSFVQAYLLPDPVADFLSVSPAPLVFTRDAASADMEWILAPAAGTLDLETDTRTLGSIPAAAVTASSPADSPRLLVWGPYRPLLLPDEAERVCMESDDMQALLTALRRIPGAVAYLPLQAVPAGMTVIPRPLPHLRLELRLRLEETFSRSRTGVFFLERITAATESFLSAASH